MKVQSNKIQPEFQPIRVQITIESALELEVFEMLTRCGITVSYSLFENEDKQKKLQNMLGDIYNAI